MTARRRGGGSGSGNCGGDEENHSGGLQEAGDYAQDGVDVVRFRQAVTAALYDRKLHIG